MSQARIELLIGEAPTVDTPVALALVTAIKKSEFPDHNKSVLTSSVYEKSTQSKPTAGHADKIVQTAPLIENIMPKWLWTLMLDPATPDNVLISSVKKFLESIGLVYANEKTYQHIVSIMALCRLMQTSDNQAVDVRSCYHAMTTLRDNIRLFRRKVKLPHYGTILVYPSTIEEFKKAYPAIYNRAYPGDNPDNQCIKCPLDIDQLHQLDAMLPCRTTHSSMNLSKSMMTKPMASTQKVVPSLTCGTETIVTPSLKSSSSFLMGDASQTQPSSRKMLCDRQET
eukprot:12401338-Karenia_brevis.AAC.1